MAQRLKEDEMPVIAKIQISDLSGNRTPGSFSHSPFTQTGWWIQAARTWDEPVPGGNNTLRVDDFCELHIGEGSLIDARAFAENEYGPLQESTVTGLWGQRGADVLAIYIGELSPGRNLAELLRRGSLA